MTRPFTPLRVALGLAAALAACGRPSAPQVADHRDALLANGDFELDAIGATPPSGWTLLNYLNATGVSGTASAPPSSFSALNLSGLGTAANETYVVGGAALSQVDPDLGAGQSFRFPAYGQRAARVNYRDATTNGKNRNANVLRQSMTTSLGDVDPVDGQIHVRFAIAPVLENPAHAFNQQPFFYVELSNQTRGTTLFSGFNVAGQVGVPWHTTTSVATGNATQWLDWQLVDISPASGALAVGDVVQLTIVASGCELGGHFGRIYVDGFGASIPGPYVSASAAQSVAAGGTLTYTIRYANGGTSQALGAQINLVTPPQTTFASVGGIAGCTTPAANAAGTVSCPLGTLAAGSSGSFTVTVNVSSSATGSIVNGNYAISAIGNPTLLGAKVTTSVLGSSAKTADIVVVKTASVTSVKLGDVFSDTAVPPTPLYTITVTNSSRTDQIRSSLGKSFTLTDAIPAQLAGVNFKWICSVTNDGSGVATAGGVTKCRDQGGQAGYTGTGHSISLSPRLGYDNGTSGGGQITIKVYGTVSASSGTMINTATASAPSGITDPNLANNSSSVSLPIGTPRTLTLNKNGTAYGTVTSAPAGISCGTSCSATSATFVSGTQVILNASPVAGAAFAGWSGNVPASCTGTPAPTSCTLTIPASDPTIAASFAAPPVPAAPAAVYAYGGSGQLAPISTAFASPLAVLVTDASGTPVPGATVTFTAVPASGGASATTASTAVTTSAGIAQVSATANAIPGTYTVQATVGGVGPATFTLTNVGPPASITYVNGGSATDPQVAPIGTPFASPLLAIVRDAAGNAVPGVTVTFTVVPVGGAAATLTSGASSGSTVTAVTDSSGMASVTAAADATVGAYTVTASVGGVATPATFQLQNVTSGPAAVYVVSGSPQVTLTSSAFGSALVAVVADAAGNSLSGVTVTFTVQPAASGATATLSAGTAVTNASGLASVTATANGTGGVYTVTASAPPATPAATPATFTLTNDAGYSIQVQSGSPQAATVGTAFILPLQALVLDGTGTAASGLTVTFQAPATGATAALSAGTAVTNASGVAAVTATANGISGSYAVAATTPNAPTPVAFNLSNQCTASTQCSSTAPICDGTSHECTACASDAACTAKSGATPYCDSSGACVACRTDSQCSGTSPVCSQATSTCSPCSTDAQCANKDSTVPFCLGTGACFPGYALVPSSSAGGAVDPAGVQTVGPGGTATFTFTPATGQHVADVAVDAASVGTTATYTFTNVQASHTVAVTFAVDTFEIGASAGAGGTIAPSGVQIVSYGGSRSFAIAPATGHHVADVVVDGASVGPVTSYGFTNVTAAHTIAASFAADTYAITVSSSGSGTISCPATVAYGDSATCTIAPSAGWVLAALTDDLADVTGQVVAGSYVVASASGPHAIVATFLKDFGTTCGAGGECGSGLCVDGVCCNGTCGGQCEACNVAGFAGACTPVLGAPAGLRATCATDGSGCGGVCNGTNVLSCTYPGAGAVCRAASCASASGTATLAASCDGAGACPASQTQACTPYVCGATACLASCTGDAQCASSGDWCNAGACQPKKAPGQSCTAANQCGTGFCADGVCCDGACGGQCEACNLSGICSTVTGAPAGSRPACAADGSACGGACDGATRSACAYPGSSTSCRSASCAGETATPAASCDGSGACPAAPTQACAPYVCGAAACLAACSADGQCATGSWCSAGACALQKGKGEICAAPGECLAGNCVDGVCCDAACDGQCEACNLDGFAGICSAVTGAPVSPRTACVDDSSGCGGTCDGSRRNVCTYPDDQTACRGASCAIGTATLVASCDGAGRCPAVQTQDCSPYLCGASACLGNCASSSDCGGGWCSGGVCVALVARGTACGGDGQCASGHCTDGVCCDLACDGQCEACNLSKTVGTCTAVTGTPAGARPACTSDGSACDGSCDGQRRTTCGYPGASVECRAADCTGGAATLAASCDGSGRCPGVQSQPCAPYVCGAAACLGNCAGDSDCAAGDYCAAGVCTALVAKGGTCSGASQCATGYCVDGVCCDGSCDGQCEACNLPSKGGTCSAVDGAPAGGRPPCASDGSLCGGSCDGVGTTACAFPDGSVSCRAAVCASGVATLAAACDAAGSCPSAQQQTCAPYLCGATACAGDCAGDGDCAAGSWCSGGVCNATRAAGQSCGRDGQCAAAHCVDGVCCDAACDGQCEACDVAGHAGTCTSVAGAPHGGARTACASDGSACGGACDGANRTACGYPGAETACGASMACGAGACVASGSAGPGSVATWKVTGSGGCSSGGAGSLAPLALVLAALRRRRRAVSVALLAVALAAFPAFARAQTTAVDVQRFQPLGGAYDLLAVPSARVAGNLELAAGAYLDYASQPLRLVSADGSGSALALVDSQTNLTLGAGLGLLDFLELSAALPVVLASQGDPAASAAPGLPSKVPGTGLGDLRLTAKIAALSHGPWHLGFALPVTLPTGSAAYLSQQGATASLRAIGEYALPGGWRAIAGAGPVFRSARTLLNLEQGTAFAYGAGGEVPFRVGGQRFAGLATVSGEVGSGWVESPAEVLLAARWLGPRGVNVTFGGGPGLSHGYGTPQYRIVAAVELGSVLLGRSEAAEQALAPPPPAPVVAVAEPAPAAPAPPPPAAAPMPAVPAVVAVAAPAPAAVEAPPPPAAPPPMAEKVVVKKDRIVILEQVHFATGRDVILPDSFPILEQVGKVVVENPGIGRLRVEGHTDSKGSGSQNLDLSRRRARSVREFLVKRGVDPARLESQGYGPARPVATNDSEDGRARNRRVEFTILSQE